MADLTAYWRPGAVKGLLLRAGVFNLFDKKYWDALTVQSPGAPWMSSRPIDWQTESGRSARVSLIYQY
ncbi:TonB-dependent receptor [Achromobacter pulmonis]|uniref:TonB-dependent receptor n=1 Tax=Achromobacter pulmonis TaxID=1389932 RepID=UPI002159CB69|nr:TonB-dependent receptor [Achromobacter pulmonis]